MVIELPLAIAQRKVCKMSSIHSARSRIMPTAVVHPTHSIDTVVKTRIKRFINAWFALQLPHFGGKYSIERMLAFEEYTRNTTIGRVLLVTIGAPLVIIALMLCQESIPLQDPGDGWKANYGFWIRAGILGAGIGYAAAIQIGFWLDAPPFSLKQIVSYCAFMGTVYVAVGMVTAELWVFPIPFFMFTLATITTSFLLAYFRIIVGSRVFQQVRSQRENLRRLNRIGSLQGFMYVAYPAYQVLFSKAHYTIYEIPVLLLLPLFRLVIKVVFASAATHKEDMIPAQVVFTVDFFDAVYMATSLQSMSSLALAAIMAIDLLQTATELHELQRQTRRILSQLHVVNSTNIRDINLLVAIRELCSSDVLNQRGISAKNIQVRSCIHHQVSEEGRAVLDRLERNSATRSALSSCPHNVARISSRINTADLAYSWDWITRWFRGANAVTPPTVYSNSPCTKDVPPNPTKKVASRIATQAKQSIILQETLQVLFTTECLTLSEYLEIFVPAVYGVFVLAMRKVTFTKRGIEVVMNQHGHTFKYRRQRMNLHTVS
ncbi:hypothetical protein F443_20722 [Phytophthora nicotianae P1569]|uniref:Uncharacterized protein n=1 Tax=Phytophthora nicotianae P1569 TaxID=1317065 RepID=V9E050_PHYNI|nr:hypothetical protein F443_20722 [Phytophthora nicotianae P1569]